MYSDPRDPWLVIFILISDLSLVLCCDIHRSTLISIMYPACMITVHDHKSRALHLVWSSPPKAGCRSTGVGIRIRLSYAARLVQGPEGTSIVLYVYNLFEALH